MLQALCFGDIQLFVRENLKLACKSISRGKKRSTSIGFVCVRTVIKL